MQEPVCAIVLMATVGMYVEVSALLVVSTGCP